MSSSSSPASSSPPSPGDLKSIRRARVIQRLREYFELSSYVDPHSQEFTPENDPRCHGPVCTKSLAAWGISNLEQYKRAMSGEMKWLLTSREEILLCLPTLEAEWGSCCQAVRQILTMSAQVQEQRRQKLPFRRRRS